MAPSIGFVHSQKASSALDVVINLPELKKFTR